MNKKHAILYIPSGSLLYVYIDKAFIETYKTEVFERSLRLFSTVDFSLESMITNLSEEADYWKTYKCFKTFPSKKQAKKALNLFLEVINSHLKENKRNDTKIFSCFPIPSEFTSTEFEIIEI